MVVLRCKWYVLAVTSQLGRRIFRYLKNNSISKLVYSSFAAVVMYLRSIIDVDTGKDEECETHTKCGDGGFLVDGSCYLLGLPRAGVSFKELENICVKHLGNLVSLNTYQEVKRVVLNLTVKKHRVRKLVIGLKSASFDVPFM